MESDAKSEKERQKVGGEEWTLWRARKTALQMCHDRGYMVTESELEETFELFLKKFIGTRQRSKELTVLLEHQFDPADQIFIFFPSDISGKELNNQYIIKYSKRLQETNVTKCIIVAKMRLTPGAKQTVRELAPRFHMDFFLESELLVNITHHKCVPEHYLLSPEEKGEMLSKYSCKETQIQAILTSDPIVRYYGAKPGQVFRIIRKSETAGRYAHYRIVVQDLENL